MTTRVHLPFKLTEAIKPECELAIDCCWFEKVSASSGACTNCNSLVCSKRCAKIFSNYGTVKTEASSPN